MRAFLIVVVLTTCCLLQALAAKYISFAHIRFELVIIAVAAYSLRMDVSHAALVGVTGGLLKGALSSAAFGVSAISLFILAIVLSWNRRLLSVGSAVTQAIVAVFAIVLYYFMSGLIEMIFEDVPFSVLFVMRYIAPVVIANALIAPLCFRIVEFIDHEMA